MGRGALSFSIKRLKNMFVYTIQSITFSWLIILKSKFAVKPFPMAYFPRPKMSSFSFSIPLTPVFPLEPVCLCKHSNYFIFYKHSILFSIGGMLLIHSWTKRVYPFVKSPGLADLERYGGNGSSGRYTYSAAYIIFWILPWNSREIKMWIHIYTTESFFNESFSYLWTRLDF